MNLKNILTFKNLIFLILALCIIKFISSIVGIFMLFFTSYVIAMSLMPIVKFLSKKMDRGLAASLVLTITVITTFAFLIPVFRMAFEQVVALSDVLPKKLDMIYDFVVKSGYINNNFAKNIDINSVLGSTSQIAQNVWSQSLSATMSFFQFVVIFLTAVMIIFYLLKDEAYIKAKFIEFFPHEMKEKAEEIINTISDKVGGYVIAQLISNTAIWILVTIVLWIFRVDYAIVLGLIAGALDIIPLIGPTVAILLIVLAASHLGAVKILLIILLFLGIQQLSNNLVKPLVFGKFMDLHPLVIILALFVCAQFLGVLGVIISPAIAATICVLVNELYLIPVNKDK